ncbi:MAG: hypothetical protein ABII39_03695 [Candidatus Micrarchaeota archaeon]
MGKKKEEDNVNDTEKAKSTKIPFTETVSEKMNDISTWFERNERFFPAIYLLVIGLGLVLVNSPATAILPIAFFLLPAYFFFRYLLKSSVFTSTALALPFSIAFDSVMFRISLLFSLSTDHGWIAIVIGWIILGLAGYVLVKRYGDQKIEIVRSTETPQGHYYAYFLILTLFAILAYGQIFGAIKPEQVFWGAHDANWQTALLTYLDGGQFEMPAYVCVGEHGYDLDSFTSSTSVIPAYITKVLSGISATGAQQIFIFLCFFIMAQGIFLLFTKVFSFRHGMVAPLFVLLPISMYPYMAEFFGMWRLTIFNAFVPWALLIGFLWFSKASEAFVMALFVAFTVTIQPFSALVLLPAYAMSFMRNFKKEQIHWYVLIGITILIFAYFTFYQITFQVIGQSGEGYELNVGLEWIEKADQDPLLSQMFRISTTNLGPLVMGLSLFALFGIVFLSLKETEKFSDKRILMVVVLLALVLASGIVYLKESMLQYTLKMRYTALLTLVFPLMMCLVYEMGKKRKWVALIVVAILIMVSIGTIETIKQYQYTDDDPRVPVTEWLKKNVNIDETVMYFDILLGQSAIHHAQVRHMEFPALEIQTIDQLAPEKLKQQEKIFCEYKRYGPFDVRSERPEMVAAYPQYIVSYNEFSPGIHEFFQSQGYTLVYSDVYFLVFRKVGS